MHWAKTSGCLASTLIALTGLLCSCGRNTRSSKKRSADTAITDFQAAVRECNIAMKHLEEKLGKAGTREEKAAIEEEIDLLCAKTNLKLIRLTVDDPGDLPDGEVIAGKLSLVAEREPEVREWYERNASRALRGLRRMDPCLEPSVKGIDPGELEREVKRKEEELEHLKGLIRELRGSRMP